MVQKHRPRRPRDEEEQPECQSIQCCDWPTWLVRARSANHSTESRGLTSPWPVLLDHSLEGEMGDGSTFYFRSKVFVLPGVLVFIERVI